MTKSKDRKVTLVKEFHTLLKNIASFSDGQAAVTKWEDDCIGDFEVTICPNEGLYKDGEFVFKISAKEDYPSQPPRVLCKTAIYHPNIDTVEDPEGEVCLNLLDDSEWGDCCTLEDVVQGILFLLYNPNPDDPLCCHFHGSITEEEYESNVRISLAGGVIDDTYIYPANAGYARKHPKIIDTENADVQEECFEGGEGDGKIKEEKREGCHSDGEGDDSETTTRKVEGHVCDGNDEDCGGGDGEGKVAERLQEDNEGDKACRTERDENVEGEDKSTVQTANTSSSGHRIVDLHFGIRIIDYSTYDSDEEEEEEEEDDDDIDGEEDGCLPSTDEEEELDASSTSNSVECCEDGNDIEDVIDKVCDIEDAKEIVNDEELESIVDALDRVRSCNGLASSEKSGKNIEGCDSFVSWSNVVYGSDNRNCVDTAAAIPSVLVPDIIVADDSITADVPMTTMTPTVSSRFYRALQTRSFRRWLV